MGLFSRTKTVDLFFVGCDGTDLDRGIYGFYLDVTNGQIVKKKFVKSLANPIAMRPFGRFMNITYRNGSGKDVDGGIWQYAMMDLQLGLAQRSPYQGKTYVDTIISPDGKMCYGIDYYNGEIVSSPIVKSKMTKIHLEGQLSSSSVDPIKQSESHPSSLCFTPDGKLVVTDLGGDEVLIYDLDEEGHLVFNEEASFKVEAGSGPRKLIFNHQGDYAYLINEISSMIHVYHYEDGHFTLVQSLSSYLKEEYDGQNMPTDLVLSEDDDYLFVTNKGDDTLVAFAIDEEHQIKRVDCLEVDEGPSCLQLFENKYLVVCSKVAGTVESFEIRAHERNGVLFETQSRVSIHSPTCIALGKTQVRVTNWS